MSEYTTRVFCKQPRCLSPAMLNLNPNFNRSIHDLDFN